MPITVKGSAPLLQVFDMPTSIAFYCDKLGFKLVTRSQPGEAHFDWALLQLGDEQLMLNTAYEQHNRPPTPDPRRIAAHNDTCIYFGCPDVDAAYEHIRAKGIKTEPPKVAPYGMQQLYFSDPDGYQLCFQWKA